MKAVILAGGVGSRLAEETVLKPKPMVEVGGRPLLWHIMKIYSHHGINDFVICAGYKGYVIKEYFANYFLHTADVTFDMRTGGVEIHHSHAESWRVTVVDSGESTMTGGRLTIAAPSLGDGDFCMTYGDGVADIDISAEIRFHREHGRLCTVTAVRPPGRFGALAVAGTSVTSFQEKPLGDGGLINGGFFVLSPRCLDYIDDSSTVWEQRPMVRLAEDGQLQAFRHDGFWQPMDSLRDRKLLDSLWQDGRAPWRVWE
jgi:glucose-1-phosphate cytidylyltransferase